MGKYNVEVLETIYPLLKDFFYHYKSYKGLLNAFDELPGEKEFWVYTIDAHLKTATIIWCMIFGSDKNETHWKNLELDNSSFKGYFLLKYEIREEQWKENWEYIVKFRNNYVAHKEIKEYSDAVPYFDIAYKAAICLDLWIRDKTQDKFPFKSFEDQDYSTDIENTVGLIIDK